MDNELVYGVTLDWDKLGFKNLNASIDKSIKMFAVATAAITAASGVIFAMGKDFAETTDELIKTSERINSTTSDIQKLTFAAEDNGATMDDVTGSLGNLAKAQEELLRGKGDFEAWGRLGVNPSEYQTTSELLIAISDNVKDLSNTEAVDLMSRVGISPKLLQTLQQGSDGLKSLGREAEALGLISTPAMLKSSQEFMSGWQRTSTMITGIMNKVKSKLLDSTINPAIKEFNKFVSKNMVKIAETLSKIFIAIQRASEFIFSMIMRISQPFIKLVNLFGGLEKAAISLGIAIGIIKYKTIGAMLPAILVVGGLFLAFDELMSFLHGEESYLGDFINNFPVLTTAIGGAAMAVGGIVVAVASLAIVMKTASISMGIAKAAIIAFNFALSLNPIGLAVIAIGALTGALYGFFTKTEIGKKVWKSFSDGVERTIQKFKDLKDAILNALSFKFPSFEDIKIGLGISDPEIPKIDDIEVKANVNFSDSLDNIKSLFDLSFPELKIPSMAKMTAGASQVFNSETTQSQPILNTTNNNQISISIDGSKDPIAVGNEVRKVLNEEMNKSAQRAGY